MSEDRKDFGKYRILDELGRGGMGVVYLAEDGLLSRNVALKVLHDHLNRESEFVARFREEARSISSLHHPNIVYVHGMEQARDAFAIDMEYIDGLSLDRFSATTRISPPLVARLGADILEGLVACHAIGIIHRDIKPSNILVTRDGVAKITDFGLATAYALHVKTSITRGTSQGCFMGTPRYASPAAWDGKKPSPDWDLFSLGVILFEFLSGEVAFSGETPMAIMKQHLTAPLPPVRQVSPGVSPELAQVVDRLLGTSGEISPGAGREMLQALRETPEHGEAARSDCVSTVTVAVRRRKLRKHAAAMGPRLRRGLKAGAVLLLTATGIGGTIGLFSGRPRLDGPQVFLRPQAIDGAVDGDMLWMLSNDAEGKPERILAVDGLGVSTFTFEPTAQESRYTVKGDWARFVRADSGNVMIGAASGSMLVAPDEGYLSLVIEQVHDRDNAREQLNLVAKPVAERFDKVRFIQAMESNEAVQSLLYNELLPRRITWADEIEGLMPSFPGGRIQVQRTGAEIEADGALDEVTWTKPPFDRDGRLGELRQRGDGESRLLMRWTPDAVLIGVDSEVSGADARLEIGLLPGMEASLRSSRRFFATLDRDGVGKAHSTAGERELPWDCDWNGGVTVRGGRFQAELRVPTAQFNELAAPAEARRWRINARLTDARGRTLAYWGSEDEDAPEHGAIIIFSEANP